MSESRRLRSSRLGGGAGLPRNVYSLDAFRLRSDRATRHTLFYLTEAYRWQERLASFPFLEVEPIDSELLLKSKLLSHTPDLILIESNIRWDEPVRLIKWLTALLDVPTVLIYGAIDLKKNPSLLKDAFTVGLHDTLRTPLKREELWEPLEVLLKARRQLGS